MRAVSTDHEFNAIHVVESLLQGDLRTGTNLYESVLVPRAREIPDLLVQLHTPKTLADLQSALASIATAARRDDRWPLLRLDVHGLEDGSGIMTTSQEPLTWEQLSDALRDVNVACHNNLLVIMAACHGANLIRGVRPTRPSPFWALVGPIDDVEPGAIDDGFRPFYEELLGEGKGERALVRLRDAIPADAPPYYLIRTEVWFRRAFHRYLRNENTAKGRRKRTEDLTSQVMRSPAGKHRGVGAVRRDIKRALAMPESDFNRIRDRFFMSDLYPENAARFPLTMRECLDDPPDART